MLPLFAYGTLRDPEYQHELFARTYPMRPAVVTGFLVRATAGGYLAAAPQPGATIEGALVYLDAAGYEIADGWEDRAIYERIEAEARCAAGPTARCFIYMYVRPAALGAPVTDERLTDRARADVIADIRTFLAAAKISRRS